MNRNSEEQKEANSLFDKLRDDLLARDLSNTESYDKAILTLSASSLGLSLAVIRYVVPVASASYLWLLKGGWTLLVLSVSCSLLAFLVSNHALKVQLNNARDYYKNGIEDAVDRKNKATEINKWLNKATGLFFIIAIILIVIFININLPNGDDSMAKKTGKSSNAIIGKRSANVPTMESVSTVSKSKGSANIPTMEKVTTSSGGSSSGSGSKKDK